MPIQKAAGAIELFTVGGSTVETHDAHAIIQINTLVLGNTLTAVFADGTPASNAFNTFARANNSTLSIDMANGKWNTSAGTSGTLTAGQLTALQTNQKNLKNGLETLANAIGLTPGTIVAWT